MRKCKTTETADELSNDEVPSWVEEDSPGRLAPYTEEELDLLVEGVIEGDP